MNNVHYKKCKLTKKKNNKQNCLMSIAYKYIVIKKQSVLVISEFNNLIISLSESNGSIKM